MTDARPGSAWETWRNAGAAYARAYPCSSPQEVAARYAASRGLPHQDIICRAFMEGYTAEINARTND